MPQSESATIAGQIEFHEIFCQSWQTVVVRKIMVFQHVAHEPLGTLNAMLKNEGFRLRYVNFERHPDFQADLSDYNGLVVLGGPMGVYEANKFPHLKMELKAIEQAFKLNIPVLGICLGAQLIAKALGAPVRKAKHREIGWYPIHLTGKGAGDQFFNGYKNGESVFQIHQDEFEPPLGAHHLATSELIPGQAFRYGDRVYGIQFHLEVDRPMIERWMKRKEHREIILNSNGVHDLDQIQADTERFISRSIKLSELSFGQFIKLFEWSGRHLVLGSR
ncbi:MAG: type 1 glutamine amidotransferase [Bdellovibrionales bacterium]